MRDTQSTYGMRHINWVRVVVDGAASHAEAHGIGHRLPCTATVSMAAAAELAGRGIPVVVTRAADADTRAATTAR
jgi:hypothetical protein